MTYAIFKTGGKQYKVKEGDEIEVEKLALEVGGEASFGDVLFFSDGSAMKIGDPLIEGASVKGKVVEQFRAKKVTAFKYKRRKGYHRKKGHRQPLTRVEITGITG